MMWIGNKSEQSWKRSELLETSNGSEDFLAQKTLAEILWEIDYTSTKGLTDRPMENNIIFR